MGSILRCILCLYFAYRCGGTGRHEILPERLLRDVEEGPERKLIGVQVPSAVGLHMRRYDPVARDTDVEETILRCGQLFQQTGNLEERSET